jgi:hypothetical protein
MPQERRSGTIDDHIHRRCLSLSLVTVLLLTTLPVVPGIAPAASAQDEGPGNLLGNPSFERAFDEPNFGPRPFQWSIDPFPPPSGTEVHQDGVEHHNGFHSALISAPDASPTEELIWYQLVKLEEGQSMTMGGWVRTDLGEGGRALLRVGFGRFRSANSWELSVETNETSWVQVVRAAEHAPATNRVYFQCVLSGPGTVWFDDVWFGEPGNQGNPPFIVSVPPMDATVGHEYTYRARAVDMEGDSFTFDLYRGPDGMTVSPEGDVNWTPTDLPEEAVKVVLRATDVSGLSSYQDFFPRVSVDPLTRPVYAYAYSGYDDPFNDHVSSERYEALLWMMSVLAEENPEVTPTVDVLFSGGDLREPGPNKASVISDMGTVVGGEGYISLGYTAFHEPTYDTSPLYDAGFGAMDWDERILALDRLLSKARDPLTGEDLPTGTGGLRRFIDDLVRPTSVAGVGGDGSQLHALDRYDRDALVLGIEDGPSTLGTMVGDPMLGTLVSMLSEDPSTPYGVYWQGGRLHLALDEAGTPPVMAQDGWEQLEDYMDALDRRRVNVVPVSVMGTGTYCNASAVVLGDQVRSPTEWAYSHPGSPQLPSEATYTRDERLAFHGDTCATLSRLATEVLPGSAGRFLSPTDVGRMVDPGSGITVSAAELATAADDLMVRRNTLRFPDWVGISWGYCRGDYQYFSLADMYGLLVQALAAYGEDGTLPTTVDLVDVFGPREEASPSQPYNRVLLNSVVAEAGRQVEDITDATWRVDPQSVVPTTSSPGGVELNAMEFLLLMAAAYIILFEGDAPANPLLNLFPTVQWPVTHLVLEAEGRTTDTGDSWTLKPASAHAQVDDRSPQVRYVTPSDGAINVPLAENVTITFSERMDETVDLAGTVVLDPPVEAELKWVYHRLLVDPVEDLAENTTYTATVGGSLTDVAGNPLAAEVTWSFSTSGLPNLRPVLIPLPEDTEAEVEENRTVRFSLFVEDDGPFPLSIEWWLDGVRVADEIDDQFVYLPGYTDAGDHTVTVVVSDAAVPPGQATITWNLTVINVNIAPRLLDTDPAEDDMEVRESDGGTFRFSVSAEDPDEGVLDYAWEVNDDPVNVSHLADGGASFTFPTGFETAGEYTVVCRVEDRVGEGLWVRWTLTVLDTNRPPRVLGIEPSLPPTVESGKAVEVEVNVTDPDGDDLTYLWAVDGLPAAETEVPTWSFASVKDGSFSITVTVVDGRGGNATASTSVNVLPQVEPQPQREPSPAIWILVVAVAAAIGLALAWPRLKKGLGLD